MNEKKSAMYEHILSLVYLKKEKKKKKEEKNDEPFDLQTLMNVHFI